MSEAVSSPEGHVLFVDDDEDVLKAASMLLNRHGARVTTARDPKEALSALAADIVDVVLLDLNFSRGARTGEEGFACLEAILAQDPEAVVIVVTGHSGVNIAVAAMRAGATDFVMKPWRNDRLIATLRSALELGRRRREASGAQRSPRRLEDALVGVSPAIERVRALMARGAPTGAPVLIRGEAGVGKTLISRAVHRQSARRSGPFVAIDLLNLADGEAARRLFGGDGTPGGFAEARGGTLVLEEVFALAAPVQARLLAALDGGSEADPRIVATTRTPLAGPPGPGGLSDDLLYRVNTVEIPAPPLRERDGDSLVLAEHFLRVFAARYARPVRPLSPAAAEAVAGRAWPGDVRGLRQAMERCVIFSEGACIEATDIDAAMASGDVSAPPSDRLNLARTERALIDGALKGAGFNVSHAARQLGLSRAALYRRMARHGL